MLTVLAFLAVFGVLILVHELGHFLMARLFKVKVLEFGFGYPPRLWGFRRGETLYSLNLLPLGGFVKLEGEEDPSKPGSLASKPISARALIIGAGAMMNAILPVLLFAVLFMVPRTTTVGDVQVMEVVPGSPAAQAGIMSGDIITHVGGRRVENTMELSRQIHLRLGSETTITLQRPTMRQPSLLFGAERRATLGQDYTTHQVRVMPRWNPPEGQGPTGIRITTVNLKEVKRSEPFWEAVPKGAVWTWETLIGFKNEITRLIVARSSPEFTGPIGIAQVTGEVAEEGILPLISLTALLSLNLAILNILPLPALDGGRLFFLAIEAVRRKRIPPEREALIHLVGFVLLITLVVAISYFDILRIVRGESLIR
jgi:regulator of sigma E protease